MITGIIEQKHSSHFVERIGCFNCFFSYYDSAIMVIAEEDLRIEMSYPFNEVTVVFLLNNPRYHKLA